MDYQSFYGECFQNTERPTTSWRGGGRWQELENDEKTGEQNPAPCFPPIAAIVIHDIPWNLPPE